MSPSLPGTGGLPAGAEFPGGSCCWAGWRKATRYKVTPADLGEGDPIRRYAVVASLGGEKRQPARLLPESSIPIRNATHHGNLLVLRAKDRFSSECGHSLFLAAQSLRHFLLSRRPTSSSPSRCRL
jgi:hypothetical protein